MSDIFSIQGCANGGALWPHSNAPRNAWFCAWDPPPLRSTRRPRGAQAAVLVSKAHRASVVGRRRKLPPELPLVCGLRALVRV